MGTITTPVIRYNLRDRGRKYRGKPRNFNVPALMDNINGGAVQERVKHRDMLGYYGHWPRVRLGLNPAEGGIVDGKVVHVEPAFVTTMLKCALDGTIEHQAEFFDNPPGRAAARLMNNKAGGWSSAIRETDNTFHGFDYVLEPNFTHNRPYQIALDGEGVDEPVDPLTLDEVAEYNESVKAVADALEFSALLDGVNAANQQLRDTILHMESEREDYIKEIARLTGKSKEVVLDDAAIRDLAAHNGPRARLLANAQRMVAQSEAAERRRSPAPKSVTEAQHAREGYLSMFGYGR